MISNLQLKYFFFHVWWFLYFINGTEDQHPLYNKLNSKKKKKPKDTRITKCRILLHRGSGDGDSLECGTGHPAAVEVFFFPIAGRGMPTPWISLIMSLVLLFSSSPSSVLFSEPLLVALILCIHRQPPTLQKKKIGFSIRSPL